eukprot:TRINITY_DN7791_c0_g1_i3.p1 TRINITY_DN7791_c0_g1~~TRINITY_DN7791_c0_g1_i3.p1  ORF type:complete len:339 (+),score=37.39 TRINITY_DN7791_c0_g1_i3:39-1055(+)
MNHQVYGYGSVCRMCGHYEGQCCCGGQWRPPTPHYPPACGPAACAASAPLPHSAPPVPVPAAAVVHCGYIYAKAPAAAPPMERAPTPLHVLLDGDVLVSEVRASLMAHGLRLVRFDPINLKPRRGQQQCASSSSSRSAKSSAFAEVMGDCDSLGLQGRVSQRIPLVEEVRHPSLSRRTIRLQISQSVPPPPKIHPPCPCLYVRIVLKPQQQTGVSEHGLALLLELVQLGTAARVTVVSRDHLEGGPSGYFVECRTQQEAVSIRDLCDERCFAIGSARLRIAAEYRRVGEPVRLFSGCQDGVRESEVVRWRDAAAAAHSVGGVFYLDQLLDDGTRHRRV